MIYSLSGKIIKKTLNAVVVSCGGVGYYVQCPTSVAGALPGVGREATLYTVMSVTENDVSLYGFATEEQQACFEMLTAVSGVGPKVGLAILSVMEPQRVCPFLWGAPWPLWALNLLLFLGRPHARPAFLCVSANLRRPDALFFRRFRKLCKKALPFSLCRDIILLC